MDKFYNKYLESDMWIDEYTKYLNDNKGECLDLGCGIGQFTKRLMEYGYNVTSSDMFIGSVNGLEGDQAIKDTAQEIEEHFWFNKNKYKVYPVYYPVGNGIFNIDKSIEDIKWIIDMEIKE